MTAALQELVRAYQNVLNRHNAQHVRLIQIPQSDAANRRLSLSDLKILLLQMNLKPSDLAQQLRCSRTSIYHALRDNNRPRLRNRLLAWYTKHSRRVA